MTKFQIARDKANERGSDVLVENNTAPMLNPLYPLLKISFNIKMNEMAAVKQKQFEQLTLFTDKWTATCERETFNTFTLSDIETDDNHLERRYVPLQKKPD